MTSIARSKSHFSDNYTHSDYLTWHDDQRWELIEGKVWCMSPAPTINHQQICQNIAVIFGNFFKDKSCRPFVAPTDVKLSETDVVQPDNFVVCNQDIIKKDCIEGVPDLIVEILSPSTELKDRNIKRDLYQRTGVKELWFVSSVYAYVEVFVLENKGYRLIKTCSITDSFSSHLFPELMVSGADIFKWVVFDG